MEPSQETLNTQERELLSGLEQHPELMERFLSILALAREPDATGRIRRADEVEALLVEQVRQLGRASLEGWARQAEGQLAQRLRGKDPALQQREKKRCAGGASSARSK